MGIPIAAVLVVLELIKMWLTPKDVQDLTGLGRDTVYALFRAKHFPSFKIGKNYYIKDDDFKKWENRLAGADVKIKY